jgi:hypothetical protein
MRIELPFGAIVVVAALALGAGPARAQQDADQAGTGKAEEPAKMIPAGTPSNKVVIAFDDKAKASGELKFVFLATGGEPVEIRVTIAKGMDDEDSADAAEKEFRVALGDDKYKFDSDDGELTIKSRNKADTFLVGIATLNVPGLVARIK